MRLRTALILALLWPHTAQAEDWGKLYPTLTWASEYRYDGVSNSSGEPSVQASLYWWRPDHSFAGIFATTVDFTGFYDPDTLYEIDVYAGYNWDFGPPYFEMGGDASRLSLAVMYTIFPDQGPSGPTYNFIQFTARGQHRVDALTVRGEVSFVPEASYGAGYAAKAEAGAEVDVTDWLKLGGEIGYRDAERRADRLYWDAGATVKWGPVDVDVRYHDTNLDYVDCGFSANCGPAVVAKVSVNFWGAWLE